MQGVHWLITSAAARMLITSLMKSEEEHSNANNNPNSYANNEELETQRFLQLLQYNRSTESHTISLGIVWF
jgi:hypothetical protein